MPATRCIAKVRFSDVRPMKTVNGEPSDVAHVLAIVLHKSSTPKREILKLAIEHVRSLRVADGGEIEHVGLETGAYNIPKLEPEAWARLEKSLVRKKEVR
jgi:hypothetical protein